MKTAIMVNRSVFLAGATATLAIAALVFADSAQARDNVYWSVGVGAPGVAVNVGNAGPVYMQAAPVYIEPEPIYYEPRPVYVRPAPIYVQPQVYYGRPQGRNKHHGRRFVQAGGYGGGYYDRSYAPVSRVYYQREGRGDGRHDRRHED